MNNKNMMGLALGLISTVGCTFPCAEAKDNFSDEKIINFGGTDLEQFRSIMETTDGNFVVVGCTSSDDIGLGNADEDAIIAKYDREGNQLWIKSYGGVDNEWNGDVYYDVAEGKNSGRLITVGYANSVNPDGGNSTAVIACYDEEGNEQWTKRSYSLDDVETLYSVRDMIDGSFITAGNTKSGNAVIMKVNGDGTEQWCKEYGDGTNKYQFNSVVDLRDGKIVAVGSFRDNNYDDTSVIVAYDENGNVLYEKKLKGFEDIQEMSYADVTRTFDGGFIAVGEGYNGTKCVGVISKYSSRGDLIWRNTYDKGDYSNSFNSIAEMKDGSYLAFGLTDEPTNLDEAPTYNGGYEDAMVVKYDKNGNQQWVKYIGGNGEDAFFTGKLLSDGSIVAVGASNSTDAGFENKGEIDAIIYSVKVVSDEEEAVLKAEGSNNIVDIENARDLVNKMEESLLREELQNRLDALNFNEVLERKTASANVDVYIKCENILMMSLDTNSVTFDDFSGIEDMEKTNAVNISINSSLPYQLNAYLPTEIQNSDKSNTMDKRILNIKENSESTYQTFANTTDKVVLKDNCPAGNDLVHGVDIKLKGGIAHEKDVYKTTIKFEAEQK